MTTAIRAKSLAEAKTLIARRIPQFYLDYVDAYAACACWHIYPAGSLALAGILIEEPDGRCLILWSPH